MLSDIQELIPYHESGIAPKTRPDFMRICGGDRLAASLLDYLMISASVEVECAKNAAMDLGLPEDHEINSDPDLIETASQGVFTAIEVQSGIKKLRELGYISPNSLFSVSVNLETVRNRIHGMR